MPVTCLDSNVFDEALDRLVGRGDRSRERPSRSKAPDPATTPGGRLTGAVS